MSLYWIINLTSLSLPLLFSFHPKIQLYQKWKALLPAILLAAIPYILWDIHFTKQAYWGFNPNYLSGQELFGLPIEECAFFFCIPYACVFTHECLKKHYSIHFSFRTNKLALLFVCLLTAILAFAFPQQEYTFWVMLSCVFSCMVCYFVNFNLFIPYLYSYLVILLPFFIVNGILTGTGIDGEVVWYQEKAFSGIRIGTIPIEDSFYAFSMLLLNVSLFELLQKNKAVKTAL